MLIIFFWTSLHLIILLYFEWTSACSPNQPLANVPNSIDTFLLIEDEQLLGFERSSPRVLVDMDLSHGLPNDLEVIWEGGSFIQHLDYWRIAFRCHHCILNSHAKALCPHKRSLPLGVVDDGSPPADALEPPDKEIFSPIPLDKGSTLSFVVKFSSKSLPLLLKFVSIDDILKLLTLLDVEESLPGSLPETGDTSCGYPSF